MNPLQECCDKLNSKAQKIIQVERDPAIKEDMLKLNVLKDSFSGNINAHTDGSMQQWAYMLRDCCKEMVSHKKLLEELKGEDYDVGIAEIFEICMFGIFHHIGIGPKLATQAMTLENYSGSRFGIYGVSSYVTNIWAASINAPYMNFMERALNLYVDFLGENYINKMRHGLHQPVLTEAFGDQFPLLKIIVQNASLMFVNSSPFYDLPHHISNKVIHIGGIVEPKNNPLNEEIRRIYEDAKDGVILFSFGTFANPDTMQSGLKLALIKAFAHFPTYRFIWKFKQSDTDKKLLENSTNVHLFEWIDQMAILGHPKTKAFITQCGLNSMNEAALSGVPTVGIPLIGDQRYNAAVMNYKRVGVFVDIQEVESTQGTVVVDALRKVLFELEYRENIQKVRRKLLAQPFSPKEKVIRWVEFAAQFPHLNELNLPTIEEMGLLAYYSWDVILVTFFIFGMILIISAFIAKFVFKSIRRMFVTKIKIA
ncbi:UDP-glucoronosyl and UDP-glucosyl transferase domain-containing protein [Ditylenchus destructor]|uniref:UDP-glucuronosyltransferase n=1 Tax=Ditylenchus destructor TaxID=166010 RepID=A0AAD4NJT4_9BILA|nr:UDP-glucoronosyl and UDP-glucosyl transferase domain-containing protein [Ditylenchus destructor]